MKKITLLIFLFSFVKLTAQSVSGYTFSEATEAYTAVTGGTNSTATGDDGSQNAIPIGFSFNFGGIGYSTFSISTNGFIRLGNNIEGNSWTNYMDNVAAQTPFIAAFWDDNNRNAGSIQYKVTGVAPSRILEVGWNGINISNGGNATAGVSGSFKMRLYETTGQIDFVYGNTMNSAGAITASIGLNDLTSFVSVTPGSPATASSTAANNGINSTTAIVGKKYTFMPQPQCAGAPTPGNTVSSAVSVCPEVEFTLSLENQSPDFGLGYQWQSSLDGTTYSNIADATNPTLTLTHTSSTYYQCVVSCGAATTASTPLLVTATPAAVCYCFPHYTYGKTDGDMIANVVITGTTLSNNSGTDPVNPSYTHFTGQPNFTGELQAGVSYEINVTVGSYGQQNQAVWIDYNDDFVFSPEERVGFSPSEIDSNETATFTILLACDPPAGIHRMRIRDVWNTPGESIDPCATYGYGETEDYDITILAGEACPAPYNLTLVQANTNSAVVTWTSGCGNLTYDVYVVEAGGPAPGNPIYSNVTAPVVLTGLVPFTAYDVYVEAHCDGDTTSSWAGPFFIQTAPVAVPNDDCETAFVLTPGGSFDEFAMTATNAGATKTIGPPNPTCATFNFGGDVWFSVVVPADGNITIETQADPGSPLIDTGMSVLTGDCTAMTAIGCSDDEGVDAFSKLTLSGLVPGSTIYARVWEYANDTMGTFRISAWNASLGVVQHQTADFSWYPNPVSDYLTISAVDVKNATAYNLLGQEVASGISGSGQMDLSALSAGTYLVKVTTSTGTKTIRILKK